MKTQLILLLFLLLSCNDTNYTSVESDSSSPAYNSSGMQEMVDKEESSQSEVAPIEQMLIKTGSLGFQVKDVEKKHQEILNSLKQYQAYVVNDQNYSSADRISYSTQIRIPKQYFDDFVSLVIKGTDHIDRKTISVEDVTEEFVDIQARLNTKKELQIRYLELLKKANKVSEMLEIEKQIGELQEEMDVIEGRMKYLQQQVNYSTLNLDYYQKLTVGNQFGQEFKNGFKNGWNNLIWFFIGLINIWPFLLIFGILTFLFVYYVRKRNRKSRN